MSKQLNDLREKDTGSLQTMEKELTENLFAARLQHQTGQLENTAKIATTRRELARIKTILRARELGLEVIENAAPGTKKEEKKAAKPATKEAKSAPAKKAPAKGKAPASKAKAKSGKTTKSAAKPAAKAGKKPASKKK